MTPVAAPADKRFRRSKVSPGRKRWRPSWWMVARVGAATIVVGFALYATLGFVLASEALTVTRITVQGNQRMSRGEVLGLLEGLSGASIVTIDLESWRQKLLTSPWVADASLRRMFPGTLAIVIEERQPIGIGRIKGRLFLIDGTGAVVDEFGPNYSDLDLPIVDGLTEGEGQNESVNEARAALAGRLMSELAQRPTLAGQVSQIDVSDVRGAVVMLKDDTALLRVGDERFAERLQSYLDLRPALRERMPDIDYVDLRFDPRVYVRPQGRLRVSGAAGKAPLRPSGASAGQAGSGGRRPSPGRRGG
ncbi:MAG TPA: FtsQ-type POTRA domain-containing protein [Vicinamibacterales bacterium]|nr:FtsQ-type POTRA domain-containing protein [Vicinamibacterales bacterium]